MGARYQNVTKEVKDYIHGLYGRPPAAISEEIRTLIADGSEMITVVRQICSNQSMR